MDSTSNVQLRRIFIDICRGYSESTWGKTNLFIKHFSHFEQLNIEYDREKFFNSAVDKKIPTLAEKKEWLAKEKLWGKDKDDLLLDRTRFCAGLRQNRAKTVVKAMQKQYDPEINRVQAEIDDLTYTKNKLIGLTAEGYADQRVQLSYIFQGFFKDEQLKQSLFTKKQYDRLDDEEVDELTEIYIEYIKHYTLNNIKKIAVSEFFTSYFYLSENLSEFFKKPLCELTYNQVNLITYGQHFRRILSRTDIPDNIRSDPERIEEFVNKKGNIKVKQGNGNGRTGYIGATEKDDGQFIGGVKDDTLNKKEISNAWEAVRDGTITIR